MSNHSQEQAFCAVFEKLAEGQDNSLDSLQRAGGVMAGAGLGVSSLPVAENLIRRYNMPLLDPGDVNLGMSPDSLAQVDKLRREISPNTSWLKGPQVGAPAYADNSYSRRMARSNPAIAEAAGYKPGPGKGIALLPKNVRDEFVAHEFGHGKFRQSRLGRALAKSRYPSSVMTNPASPIRLLGAGALGVLGASRGLKDPSDRGPVNAGALLGAGIAAPMLIDEGAASLNAIKGMKNLGYSRKALRGAKKRLAKAFGGYAAMGGAMAGIPVAGTAVGDWIRRNPHQREDDE